MKRCSESLVEHSPVPVFIIVVDRIMYANASAVNTLGGQARADILSHSLFDFISPGYHSQVRSLIDRIATGEITVEHLEAEFLPLDHRPIVVSVSACAFSYENSIAAQVHFVDITRQKTSEQECRLYADLLEQAHEPILTWELDGPILFWNEAAEQLYGWTRRQVIGISSHELLDTEQISPGQPFFETLRNRGHWSGELLHRAKDGSRILVESRQRVINGREGRRVVLESNEDIAPRRAAEDAARSSEARFRATFEQAAVGLAHVDLNGRWLWVNQRLCDILGYSRQELLNLTFGDVTYPPDLEADWAQVHALLNGASDRYSMEKRYIRKNQELVWANLTVALARDDAGQPSYFISVIEDISSRKRTEAELQESEHRFRLLFELSPVPKYLINPADTSIVAANLRAAGQLGYTRNELLKLRVSDFDITLPSEEIRSKTALNLAGERMTFETQHRTKTGNVRDVIVTSEAVVLEGRTLIYASVLDITERKHAEQKVRELAATLERRVEERTRELDQQRLFLQALLDTVDVGIVSCDAAGRLTLFTVQAGNGMGFRKMIFL